MKAPLTDSTIVAVSRLFDDAGATREPSHSEIEFQITRAGLGAADPCKSGPPVGKAKRIRGTLSWALEQNASAGEMLVGSLIVLARTCGGFRSTSDNFVGREAIGNAMDAFRSEGYEPPQRRLERSMYEVACSVNGLRNKVGTGHGRPWLPDVSDAEARTAIELMGTIAEAMLSQLHKIKSGS